MSKQKDLAEKNDALLAELKTQVLSEQENVEEAEEIVAVEETTEEESAPAETNASTEEETEESDNSEEEVSEEVEEDEELSEEDKQLLSEKTRRQMSKLREKARKTEELQAEIERLKEQNVIKKPLEDVKTSILKEDSQGLPWQNKPLTRAEAKKIAREELERENQLKTISTDADVLESTYPEFDSNHGEYDADLTSYVYKSFRDAFSVDSSVRLKDFAERHMAIIRKAQDKVSKKVEAVKTAKKKASSQAMPTSISPPKRTRTISQKISGAKTIEELEKLKRHI